MAVSLVCSEVPDNDRKFRAVWSGFAASGDAGAGVKIPADTVYISVESVGTYTGGLSIQLQGSNDGGATWLDLGVTAFTANALRACSVFPDLIRPAATAGTGGASCAMYLVCHR